MPKKRYSSKAVKRSRMLSEMYVNKLITRQDYETEMLKITDSKVDTQYCVMTCLLERLRRTVREQKQKA